MSLIGVVIPDQPATFGRCLVRSALLPVDPTVYGIGFADGQAAGLQQGYPLGYSLGTDDGEDDTPPAYTVAPAAAPAADLTSGYALAGLTDADEPDDGFATGFASAPRAAAAPAPVAYAPVLADDTDELPDGGFAAGFASNAAPRATTAPAVAAVSPTPNTPPGAVGGMPSAYNAAAQTPVIFNVTDADGDLALVQISALFLDGTAEVVYRGGTFTAGYVSGSSRFVVSGGFQFSIRRTAGWPAGVPAGALAVGLAIDATDAGGNATSATLYYQMPARLTAPPPAAPELTAGAVDLFTETRSLIVWQLRLV